MQARLLAMTSQASRHQKRPRLTTASPVKLWVSGLVASEAAGRFIGALTRHHIRHQASGSTPGAPIFHPECGHRCSGEGTRAPRHA
jgi:hypothetical protein